MKKGETRGAKQDEVLCRKGFPSPTALQVLLPGTCGSFPPTRLDRPALHVLT